MPDVSSEFVERRFDAPYLTGERGNQILGSVLYVHRRRWGAVMPRAYPHLRAMSAVQARRPLGRGGDVWP